MYCLIYILNAVNLNIYLDESQMKASGTAAHKTHDIHAKQSSVASDRQSHLNHDFDEPAGTAAAAISATTYTSVVQASPVGQKSPPTPPKAGFTKKQRSGGGWKRFLCCVSTHAIPDNLDHSSQKPVDAQGEPMSTPVPVQPNMAPNTTVIKARRKWTSIFKKKQSEVNPSVVLTAVNKQNLSADERLKAPVPYLLVTRHEANDSTDHDHGDENGVPSSHLIVDDRMSESTNSRDSLRTDDSYSEPLDQVSIPLSPRKSENHQILPSDGCA